MNRDKLSKRPLIEILHYINMNIEDCLYQLLSNTTDDMRHSRCNKMKCCYDCLSEWLNEGGRKMYVGKEWLEPCEVNALVDKLKAESDESKGELLRAKALLMQIRAYYSATPGWDMYEDDVIALIGKKGTAPMTQDCVLEGK